jgi:hypothetical protein
MPIEILAGQCDEKLAERLALPLAKADCVAGRPGSGGLPLDPAEWPGLPGFEDFVAAQLESFGLAPAFDAVRSEEHLGAVTWRTPVPSNFDGNRLKLAVLGGVTHQYPRCTPGGCNNPYEFSAADRFWQFFSQYSLAGCPAP